MSQRSLIGLALLTALALSIAAASLLRGDRPDTVAAAGSAPAPAIVSSDEEPRAAELVLPDASSPPAPAIAPAPVPEPDVEPVAPELEPDARNEAPEREPRAVPTHGVVGGTIVDGASGAPCDAEVWLSIPGQHSTNLVTQAMGGVFEQRIETPGSYALLARCGGKVGLLRDIAVELGGRTEGLMVTLRDAARVRVADVDPGEGDAARVPWTCTLFLDGAPIGVIVGAGEAELAVPPGSLTARLVVPGTGRQVEQNVTVASGELAVIRFD